MELVHAGEAGPDDDGVQILGGHHGVGHGDGLLGA
jgi:hypothetical protein